MTLKRLIPSAILLGFFSVSGIAAYGDDVTEYSTYRVKIKGNYQTFRAITGDTGHLSSACAERFGPGELVVKQHADVTRQTEYFFMFNIPTVDELELAQGRLVSGPLKAIFETAIQTVRALDAIKDHTKANVVLEDDPQFQILKSDLDNQIHSFSQSLNGFKNDQLEKMFEGLLIRTELNLLY